MEQPPLSVGDAKYKVGDVVTVRRNPPLGDITGEVRSVQVSKDPSGKWTHQYTIRTERAALAAREGMITGLAQNGGKRKGKSRRRKAKSRRTRRTFSR